jgi:hypothetical protein
MGLLVAKSEGLQVGERCPQWRRPAWVAPGILAILLQRLRAVVSRRLKTLAVWDEADPVATKFEPLQARGNGFAAT